MKIGEILRPARRFPALADLVLLLLRLALGAIFIAHGWQKFRQGRSATAAGFEEMGVPLPGLSALYATWVELLGGLALVLGLAVPLAGLLLFVDMLGAFLVAHADKGIFVTDGGFELVLALGAGSLLLAALGGGRFGLDGLLGRERSGHHHAEARHAAHR